METSTVVLELRKLLAEAESVEDAVCRHQIEWARWEAAGRPNGPLEWLVDEDREITPPFKRLLESLYLSTVCLLDSLNLKTYLELFFEKFGRPFDLNSAVEKYEIDIDSYDYAYNVFLRDLRHFLNPIGVVGERERYLWHSGVHYLENVLKNTASIIHKLKKVPTSETELYKSVKFAVEAVFPSSTTAKSAFSHTAQEYKPDILIPELNAAVEYKYAVDEAKLKATIAQIADDVKGYTGDFRYHLFYAVFYVKHDFWGEEKFKVAWSEKKFPKNWRAFWVVGA